MKAKRTRKIAKITKNTEEEETAENAENAEEGPSDSLLARRFPWEGRIWVPSA
jgi:hypothetical protein